MDHRDVSEPTVEPVAPPPAVEAPAHHDVLAAASTAHEPEPLAAAPAEAAGDEPELLEAPVAEVAVHEPQTPDPTSHDSQAHQHAFGEPAAIEPAAIEPAAIEPVAIEPAANEPAPVEAAAVEPVAAEPVAAEPVATEPVASETVAAEPVAAEPVATEPVASETAAHEAVASDAEPRDVVASEPTPSEPTPSEPTPSEPVASESTPSEPVAGETTPDQPVAPPPVDPRRLRAQQAWDRVVAAHTGGEQVAGTVTAAVKGGLLVDVGGIRGFLPASQVRVPIGTAIEALVKTKVPLKVLDIDAGRRRIVVSQRRAVDEERRTKRSELLRSLEVGQIREAVVARLADFGAFVDLGGVDGLIPMRELAFERVEKTSDVVSVGDLVTVQVLRIEEGGKKIALSRKNALPDPWRDHAALLRNGTTIEGKVVAKEPQLVVELAPGITGSVRTDEADPADYELGEAIEVTVRSVDRVRRRINLTTMQAQAAAAAAAAAAVPQTSMTASGFAPLGIELAQRKK
jgi:predicted RNA-binding protein with RPS1 domain